MGEKCTEMVKFPFDLSVIKDAFDGNKELFKELVTYFIDNYPKKIQELKEYIKNGDTRQIERTAHFLKGSISNFGYNAYYEE